jgi:hypothetical protein
LAYEAGGDGQGDAGGGGEAEAFDVGVCGDAGCFAGGLDFFDLRERERERCVRVQGVVS